MSITCRNMCTFSVPEATLSIHIGLDGHLSFYSLAYYATMQPNALDSHKGKVGGKLAECEGDKSGGRKREM